MDDIILPSGLSRKYAPPPVGAEILAMIGVGMGVIVCVGVIEGVAEIFGVGVTVEIALCVDVVVGGIAGVNPMVGVGVAATMDAGSVGVITRIRFFEPYGGMNGVTKRPITSAVSR